MADRTHIIFRSVYRVEAHEFELRREGQTITVTIDGEPHPVASLEAAEDFRDTFQALARELHAQIELAYPDPREDI